VRQFILKIVVVSIVAFVGINIAAPAATYAVDPLDAPCADLSSEQRAQSPTCSSRTDKNPLTGTNGVLMKVANIVAVIAGIVAVIMVMVNGFRMITANGDAQAFGTARSGVIGAVIGVIIIIAARSLVILILERI